LQEDECDKEEEDAAELNGGMVVNFMEGGVSF